MAGYRLWVRRTLLSIIQNGSKDLEVRINEGYIPRIQVGDTITFNESCTRRVKAIRRYKTFWHMLQAERADRLAPGYSLDQIKAGLKEMYSSGREGQKDFEILVFELESVTAW